MENNNGLNLKTHKYMEPTSTQAVTKGFTVVFMTECLQIIQDLRWMIVLAISLIIADFWFGINVSKVKKVEIRKSRAGRRTLNKFVDYICYILVGAAIGKAIGEPYGMNPTVVAVSVMVICYCFEIDSIYGHICTLHGIQKRYSIWKIFWLLLTFKFKGLSEAFKDMSEQSKNYKNNKANEDVF